MITEGDALAIVGDRRSQTVAVGRFACGRAGDEFRRTAEQVLDVDLRAAPERHRAEEVPQVPPPARARLGATSEQVVTELRTRLEEAFGSQKAFISDAGHELRTPITIIRGHLELMGDEA